MYTPTENRGTQPLTDLPITADHSVAVGRFIVCPIICPVDFYLSVVILNCLSLIHHSDIRRGYYFIFVQRILPIATMSLLLSSSRALSRNITHQNITYSVLRSFTTTIPLQQKIGGSNNLDRNPKIKITLEQLRMAARGKGRNAPICHEQQEKIMNALEAAKYEVCVFRRFGMFSVSLILLDKHFSQRPLDTSACRFVFYLCISTLTINVRMGQFTNTFLR